MRSGAWYMCTLNCKTKRNENENAAKVNHTTQTDSRKQTTGEMMQRERERERITERGSRAKQTAMKQRNGVARA